MKITINVNGTPVEINLTEDQIKVIETKPKAFNWKYITSWDKVLELYPDLDTPYPTDTVNSIQKRINAHFILAIVFEIINEGWIPDWKNPNQEKWRACFYFNEDKSCFSSSACSDYGTCSVGCDLHLGTREKLEHVLKYFKSKYLTLLV